MDAAAAFEKAAAIAPALVPAREELAELYGALGRRADELEQLQLIAVLDRSRPERQVALGLAQARSGQEELAVRDARPRARPHRRDTRWSTARSARSGSVRPSRAGIRSPWARRSKRSSARPPPTSRPVRHPRCIRPRAADGQPDRSRRARAAAGHAPVPRRSRGALQLRRRRRASRPCRGGADRSHRVRRARVRRSGLRCARGEHRAGCRCASRITPRRLPGSRAGWRRIRKTRRCRRSTRA